MATRKYGKNALSAGLSLTGIDEYLKKIEDVGKNVDEAVKKAIDESVKPILKDMLAGAERHRDSGDVVEAIEATPAVITSTSIYSKVGIDLNKHPEAFHAVYAEYGDGHSNLFPDPFIRPAFDNNVQLVKKIQREILKKEGMPIE